MDDYVIVPGPDNDSVLYEQDQHVSSAVWEGQERGALTCHEHTSTLHQWVLTEQQIELVKKSGFEHLRLIQPITLDRSLISALVERWRKETNTFHMTIGEVTVSLEDVAYLLGLPIDGKPVTGVTGRVKLTWLRTMFSSCPKDASSEDVVFHTRAYLLYLVGSTIFSTADNQVPAMYLQLFGNFDEAGNYAWGAAALSFLYRALGNAAFKSQKSINGCLTMLQCWSYYHLNIGRPTLQQDRIDKCFPLVLRWKGTHKAPTPNLLSLRFYRHSFDSLNINDVVWCPYKDMYIPENFKNQLILGRSKTMIICFDFAERHLPDRCLRQFGIQQTIPKQVHRWERKMRGTESGVNLSEKFKSEVSEWGNRHSCIVGEVDGEKLGHGEYMKWYFGITRKVVGIPDSQTVGALKKIRRIASESTQGMDAEKLVEVITRIRDVTDQGLGVHFGSSENDVRKRKYDAENCDVIGPSKNIIDLTTDDRVDATEYQHPPGQDQLSDAVRCEGDQLSDNRVDATEYLHPPGQDPLSDAIWFCEGDHQGRD
ncbi:hypothetical protein ACS0TY_022099 [Phlomoides rotata]